MYQTINSSIVSKGAMNCLNKMFPLARIFPLAVMYRGRSKKGHVTNSNLFEPFFPATQFLLHYILQGSADVIVNNNISKSTRVSLCLR